MSGTKSKLETLYVCNNINAIYYVWNMNEQRPHWYIHMIPADGHGANSADDQLQRVKTSTIHIQIPKCRILGLINHNDLDLREQHNDMVLLLNNDMTWKAHATTLFCKNWPDRGSGRLMTHFYVLCCLHHHRWLL